MAMAVARLGGGNSFAIYWLKLVTLGTIRFWWKFRLISLDPMLPRQYTPLTTSVSQILREVQYEKFLRWPSQIKSDLTKRDNTKYYEFHKDHGNRTDDCIQLRKEIEYLI